MMKGKKAAVKRLREIQGSLTILVGKKASLPKQFRSFSDDCIKRMRETCAKCRKVEDKRKVIEYYLKAWFHSFLAHKDEMMALWKGTLVRKYQIKDHKAFTPHDRGHENSYYKRCLALTECSADGVNYEYRKLVDQYGESDSLDAIADANEANDAALNEAISDLDSLQAALKEAMVDLGAARIDVKISSKDNKHMGEEMCFVLSDASSSPLLFTRVGEPAWQQESAVEALCTTLDDPDWLSEDIGAVNGARGKRAMVVMTTEDVEASKQAKYEKIAQKRAMEDAEKSEKGNTKGDSFDTDVSLDEIKRTFGNAHLQSTFVRMDAEELGLDPGQLGDVGATMDGRITAATSASAFGMRSVYTGEENVANEPAHEVSVERSGTGRDSGDSAGAEPRHVNQPVVSAHTGLPPPLTRVVLARVLVPAALIPRVGGQWLELLLSISALPSFVSGVATESAADLVVAASDVLEEVHRRLWSRVAKKEASASRGHRPVPLLARHIQLVEIAGASTTQSASLSDDSHNQRESGGGSKQYLPGAVFVVSPQTTSLFVVCCDQPAVNKVLTKVGDVIAGKDEVEASCGGGSLSGRPLVVPQRDILMRIASWLDPGAQEGRDSLDLSDLGLSLRADEHVVIAALQRVATSSSLAPHHLPISHVCVSGSSVGPALLALLLLLARRVEASGLPPPPENGSTLLSCGRVLREVLISREANTADASANPVPDGGRDTKAHDAQSNEAVVKDTWLRYCANTGTQTSALTSLVLRHNIGIWQHSSSSAVSISSEGVAGTGTAADPSSTFFAILLHPDLFPSLSGIDVSHSLSRKPLRSLNQAQNLISELIVALAPRVHRRNALVQAMAVEEDASESTPALPEIVHVHVHGLNSVVTATSSSGGGAGVEAALADRRRDVQDRLSSLLGDTASAAVVYAGGKLAVL